jgi:hypothetical protein
LDRWTEIWRRLGQGKKFFFTGALTHTWKRPQSKKVFCFFFSKKKRFLFRGYLAAELEDLGFECWAKSRFPCVAGRVSKPSAR